LERNPSPGTQGYKSEKGLYSPRLFNKGLFHFCNPECLDLDFFSIFMNFQPFQEHQRIQGTPAALQLPFV